MVGRSEKKKTMTFSFIDEERRIVICNIHRERGDVSGSGSNAGTGCHATERDDCPRCDLSLIDRYYRKVDGISTPSVSRALSCFGDAVIHCSFVAALEKDSRQSSNKHSTSSGTVPGEGH